MTVEVTGGASTTSRLPSRMLTGLRSVATAGCRIALTRRGGVRWDLALERYRENGEVYEQRAFTLSDAPRLDGYKKGMVTRCLMNVYG